MNTAIALAVGSTARAGVVAVMAWKLWSEDQGRSFGLWLAFSVLLGIAAGFASTI